MSAPDKEQTKNKRKADEGANEAKKRAKVDDSSASSGQESKEEKLAPGDYVMIVYHQEDAGDAFVRLVAKDLITDEIRQQIKDINKMLAPVDESEPDGECNFDMFKRLMESGLDLNKSYRFLTTEHVKIVEVLCGCGFE